MNIDELNSLISQGESETLEFKTSTGQLAEVGKTLSGFLNHKGGIVLIGINEKNQIVGQQISDKTQQDIAQVLKEISPSAPITWQTYDLPNNDRKVIILKTNSSIPPAVYFFKDKSYERVGSTTQSMKYEHLKQLMLERTLDKTWDQLPASDYKIDDLDHDEIIKTVEEGISSGRLNDAVIPKGDIFGILRGLELTTNGVLNNAAVVLFAKKMSSSFSHCEIKMARFQGETKSIGFIDEKRCVGHAFQILKEAETFVRRHLNIAMKFMPNSLQREDIPQLPFLAIREALINAICHRDYVNSAGSISLAIFDDRLDIWNMGELSKPLSFDDLKIEHDSILRNRKIAHVFYVRKFIEKWGSGTTRIINLCKNAGVPEPKYYQHTGGFCISFKFSESALKIEENKKTFTYSNKLTKRHSEIIAILKSHSKGLAVSDILNLIDEKISLATLKRELEKMKKMNIVITEGKGRSTYWIYIQQDENKLKN